MRYFMLKMGLSVCLIMVFTGASWSADLKSAISEIENAFSVDMADKAAGAGGIKVVVYTTDMKGVVKSLSAIKWEKIQSVVENFEAKTISIKEGEFFDVGGRSYAVLSNDGSFHLNFLLATSGKMGSIAVDDESHTFITEDGYIFSILRQTGVLGEK